MFSVLRGKSFDTRRNPQTDLRTLPRMNTYRFVEICNEGGSPLVEATVREVSRKGAYVRMNSAKRLPDRVGIRFLPDGHINRATKRWIAGKEVGLEFDDDFALN